jgi:hypothetical protein
VPRKQAPRRSASSPTAKPRKRLYRSTISLPPELRARLELRGARSDKSHGPYNYTRQLARTLALYDTVLEKSDPRQTRDMPEKVYELVLELLADPLALEAFHIHRLGDYLFDLKQFRERVRQLDLDPQQLSDALNAYPFAEKLHLVDAAQIRHAPPLPS